MNKRLLVTIGIIGALLATMLVGCVPEQAERGLTGPAGPKGEQGIQGPQGERGLQGIQGIQGEKGRDGKDGKDGKDGQDGDDGDDGRDGARGYTGATGATGVKGDKGDDGYTPIKGVDYFDGTDGTNGTNGTNGQNGVPTMFLVLVSKDSSWNCKPDEGIGFLTYTAVGDVFSYWFKAQGLEDTDYSLIYYADTEDRYNDWGGDNPGAVIAEFTATSGEISITHGEIDLGYSLPHPSDANGYHYDYSLDPDNYAHPFGAKIWLVPSDCLTDSTVMPVENWEPSRFLFETDLIYYIDTD